MTDWAQRKAETQEDVSALMENLIEENVQLRQQNTEMKAMMDKIEKWKYEGTDLVFQVNTHSIMFCLGEWWADRPWRKR